MVSFFALGGVPERNTFTFHLYSKRRLQVSLLSLSIIKHDRSSSFNSSSCAGKGKMLVVSPIAVACRGCKEGR